MLLLFSFALLMELIM